MLKNKLKNNLENKLENKFTVSKEKLDLSHTARYVALVS
jgi:hypothetical protein